MGLGAFWEEKPDHPDRALSLVLAISSALKLNMNRLDIKTAFLNGEIPNNEQLFCSPPVSECQRVWDGLSRKACQYGAHQSGFKWAKNFHA
jgi:hypothetical protein